ncbi:PREDICTED: uncharacterized protein LOC109221549 [Nicotiana attenuata]|uniref:uncharacterized protein LOC109221549 n=1 Tax=Nicotiana attenuata TaxID=49451 RepID=UPI00090527B2|nr:PREDICTED: uncharacterized protein LOC109221549 [Nicotiana attenuata]
MGSSLFWFDNWTGLGALYFNVPQDFGIDETVHNVFDVVEGGAWNVDRLFEILPEDLAMHILEKIKPPSVPNVVDVPYWMLEPRGYFSVKSAWRYLRRREDPKVAFKMIWVKGLPFKIAFFHVENPKEETMQHLFFQSDTARFVWRYFLSGARIRHQGLTLHQAITKCWTVEGLVKVRKPRIENVPHRWHDLLAMMENFIPKLKVTKVQWEFPSAGGLKVNTDGASRGNPGRSAIGYCIKDDQGDIVLAVGKQIHETTNTVAEAVAIVEALQFCRSQHMTQVCIQTDSMLMKKIITGEWKPPWCIIEEVEEINQLMEGTNCEVSHIFREGNKLADHLANYALDFGDIECHEFGELDSFGRRIVNEDKLQCPHLRVQSWQSIWSSKAAFSIRTSTCNMNEEKQGNLLVNSSIYRTTQPILYHRSTCSRQTRLYSGAKASQSHVAVHISWFKENIKQQSSDSIWEVDKTGAKMKFKGDTWAIVRSYV